MTRIGELALDALERELQRLDLQVPLVAAAVRRGAELTTLEHPEREQGRDAGAIRRHLPHGVTAVIEPDRLHPFALVRGQVVRAQRASGLAGMTGDALGDHAA